MDSQIEVDHYIVLGLPSGEQGAKLTVQEITTAYKQKALELHPDKCPNDPNANANFQKLNSSYQILKDEKSRQLFDKRLSLHQRDESWKAFQDFLRRCEEQRRRKEQCRRKLFEELRRREEQRRRKEQCRRKLFEELRRREEQRRREKQLRRKLFEDLGYQIVWERNSAFEPNTR